MLMTTKLTLSIDQNVVEKAKIYLQTTGQSLSGLVEEYFRLLIKTKEGQSSKTPILKELSGLAKGIKKSKDEVIADYLQKKYS